MDFEVLSVALAQWFVEVLSVFRFLEEECVSIIRCARDKGPSMLNKLDFDSMHCFSIHIFAMYLLRLSKSLITATDTGVW